MYLSPDERFLVSTLYDLSVDPQKEVARIASNVTKLLMRDESPKIVGTDNRITLVEFVDFECPYCKQFAAWYSALPDSLQRQTTLVFKNLPVPQHPWAHSAAVYAVCANSQSPSAFRKLVTFLFDTQSQITPQNLKQKVLESLRQSNALDTQKLEACASGKEASEIVERDLSIAKQLNVNNTPTLFINGRRVLRVASRDELQHLLETELSNIDSITAQAHAVSASR
jgi:protein-disulfide isomerase